jgi:hypothetical protein
MAKIEDTVRCDGCGVEILGAPLVVAGLYYCCQDCRDGLECDCSERLVMMEEERSGSEGMAITERYF